MRAVVFLKYTERERESCEILSIIVITFGILQVVNVEAAGARDWATQLPQEPKSGRNDEGHDSWHYRHGDACGKETGWSDRRGRRLLEQALTPCQSFYAETAC